MKKILFPILAFALFSAGLHAENAGMAAATENVTVSDSVQTPVRKKVNLDFGFDFMSSYVCRGAYQTGASIQPKFMVEYSGFRFDAWGSTDFVSSDMQEVDLTLSYKYRWLKVALTDYYVSGSPLAWGGSVNDAGAAARPPRKFFDTNPRTTPHVVELAVYWQFSEKVPVTVQWGTVFFGNDFMKSTGKRTYTSYFEVFYPFKVFNYVDMKAGVGGVPWATDLFGYDGFAITNVYLHAIKMWEIKAIKMGVLARLICNPARQEMNFVGGLAFAI